MIKYLSMFIIITITFFSAISLAKQTALIEFGSNPGELTASYFQGAKNNKNLIVLLHGCVQQGEMLAQQSGLMALANKKQFSLLIPQQSQKNNIKGCFNWFSSQDIERNQGESLSIKNMITSVNAEQNFSNIYIIGLSAGGAMASSVLVNYPDLFTAGAIIAGIPYPCANNLITAIACMRSGPSQDSEQLTQLVHQINSSASHWPALSIWTGTQDAVVNPKNSQQLAIHWAELTQSSKQPIISKHQGYKISQWQGQNKQVNVELIEVENMGHGIAVAPQKIDGGSEAPFVIDTPISTVLYLLDAWKI
jgi:poly(hydroxyalkanoate) depolymerase family esterase